LVDFAAGNARADDAVVRRRESPVGTLTLLRHGQSEFNRAHRFTGWADVDLTAAGEAEAARAGSILREYGVTFDRCFTSALRRASRTAEILLRAMALEHIPIEQSWRLNERHYGALQGLDTWSAVRRYGVLRVLRVRHQYVYRPPALEEEDAANREPTSTCVKSSPDDRPISESFADVRARLVPFWTTRVAPELARGRSVLMVSHKHTLRALFAVLTGVTSSLRVATGVPIVLTLDRSLSVTEHRALTVVPAQ
jgi:2,3-bisphosphoglycerate-dependent phosphoglycerate mutase